MIDKKADILLVVLGGNPFPNFISIATRVKEKGKIICIVSDRTSKGVYEKLKKTVNSKMDVDFDKVVIDISNSIEYVNRKRIEEKIAEKLKELLSLNSNIDLIEINYTGGTKLMSISSYELIKNFKYHSLKLDIDISLTYIDPERERMYFEYKEKDKDKFRFKDISLRELVPSFNITVKDVIETYIEDGNVSDKNHIEMPKLSNSLGNLFCNIEKPLYDKRIEIFGQLYFLAKKKDIEGINKVFLDYNLIPDYKNIDFLGFKKKKDVFKYFTKTKWLEDYILNILLQLKDEGVIEDVSSNVEHRKNKQTEFEVDFAAFRKYKLFAISVTSIDKPKEAKGKLYEIKQRAKNLAGDEAGICYINLCWETDELKKQYRNIWDRDNLKNSLILGAQDFHLMKEKLREWFKGGGNCDTD